MIRSAIATALLLIGTAAAAESPRPTFVGSAACSGCHEKATAAWHGSHHDLAMQVASDETVLGRFDGAKLVHFGVTTTFSKKDGKYVIRTEGPDGKLADYEVLYTFGVSPLQQYLVAFPGGRFQAPPVAWDTRPKAQGGQRWFSLQPDERVPPGDLLHWTGVVGNWNQMCSECHSTDLRKNFDAAKDSYDTKWSELSVGCEACHGPGSNHVAWAQQQSTKAPVPRSEPQASGETDNESQGNGRSPEARFPRSEPQASGDAPRAGLAIALPKHDPGHWVMNPETGIAKRSEPLTSRAEMETCGHCHSRRGLVSEDYEFGKPLLDTHRVALLEDALYHADGQIKDEVYEYGSFEQSKMFAAGVTCSDCHDPHSGKLRNVTSDPNTVCAQCHLPAKFATPAHYHHPENSKGASCVACHMPEHLYMVIDARRDHSIRVPRPDLTVKIGTPNACNGCHAKESPQWAADAAAKWYGTARANTKHYGEAIQAGRRNLPGAESALAELASDPSKPAIARATALSLMRNYLGGTSGPVLQSALQDPDPMLRAAALTAISEIDPRARVPLAAPLLVDPVRSVRIDAARAIASVPATQVPEQLRPIAAEGLGEYRGVQELNADRPEGRLNLAVLALDSGDAAEAERQYQAALRLAPALPTTYVNLADLYRAQNRDADGEKVLRKGLEVAPQSADLQHALGLLLVREKRMPDALAAFARSTELDPDAARYAYVYAIALHSAGQSDRAVAELERAYARHPGDVELVSALATTNKDRGDHDKAVEWAHKLVDLAPQDPNARALLDSLSGAAPAPGPPPAAP